MRSALTLVAVPCLLMLLGASKPRPHSEEDKGAGFGDIAFAAGGTFLASADGTVRRVEGDALPVVVDAGRRLVTLAVSEDGKHLAAVGAGVVARSSDGGRTFRMEPTPDGVLVYAAAFSGSDLLLFDVKGRGFRSPRSGGGFQLMQLPRTVRYWTASFSGRRGYVIGVEGILLATEDGGRAWRVLEAPTAEAEAVLAVGNLVWVSGAKGVFRSDDGGQHFRQVFASKGNCYRMGARGTAVVVACAPVGQVLAYAEDGEKFQVVPVLDAAALISAGIAPNGEILAAGANDLFIRATPQQGRVIITSETCRKFVNLMARARVEEELGARRKRPSREPDPAE